jgi:hypothetical protein
MPFKSTQSFHNIMEHPYYDYDSDDTDDEIWCTNPLHIVQMYVVLNLMMMVKIG